MPSLLYEFVYYFDNKIFVFFSYILDINECESRPCMNNGKCIDEVNKYNCQCMAGYTGLNCEIGKYGSLMIYGTETYSITTIHLHSYYMFKAQMWFNMLK